MTTLDDLFFIPKEIRERICIHRGLFKSEDKENTVSAIRDAVELNPYFVEFDIQKYNGSFFSGHPPAIVTGNDGKLGNILSVYSEHARQVRANGQNFVITILIGNIPYINLPTPTFYVKEELGDGRLLRLSHK